MSGGGGGGGPAPQDNSLQIAQMQLNAQQADQQRQDAQKAADEAKFVTNRDNAYTGAQANARTLLTGRGLNPDDYMGIISSALDDTKARIPDADPNPASYFTNDVINNALTQEENQRRIKNTGVVNNTFAPGYDTSALSDTADDPYINEILSGQYSNAQKALDYAKARGQLNDTGYSGAVQKLDSQKTGAQSTLDSLGSSVIAKDRTGLGNIKSDATTAANDYTLGGPTFDINPYSTKLTDAVGNYTKNLKGDITNALGGTQLFDTNDILLSGARAQGPQNLTTVSLPGAPVKKNNTDRGLGSQGAF